MSAVQTLKYPPLSPHCEKILLTCVCVKIVTCYKSLLCSKDLFVFFCTQIIIFDCNVNLVNSDIYYYYYYYY